MSLKSIDIDGNPNRSRRFRMYDLKIDNALQFNQSLSDDTSVVGYPISSTRMRSYREQTIILNMQYTTSTPNTTPVTFQLTRVGGSVFLSWLTINMPDMTNSQSMIASTTALPARYLPIVPQDTGVCWARLINVDEPMGSGTYPAFNMVVRVTSTGFIQFFFENASVAPAPILSVNFPSQTLHWKI